VSARLRQHALHLVVSGGAFMSTITDPRKLVQSVDLTDLVIAYASGSRHPFALQLYDGETWFVCPRCGRCDHNGGTAKVLDRWRWHCGNCRHTGTRYQLERIVLESADAIEALCEQVQQ